jgi:hypothetical protein
MGNVEYRIIVHSARIIRALAQNHKNVGAALETSCGGRYIIAVIS